jgi:hypothetical protein
VKELLRGARGTGAVESDAALDFVVVQIDRYVALIRAIVADEQRFRLDEDAEGALNPSVDILFFLCERCGGSLPEELDIRA